MAELVLETVGLTKDYGRFRAVHAVDLQVRRGEIYGFLGRNGAGKTTTIRMILGLVQPSAGEVRLFGHPLASNPTAALARMGSLVETASAYPNLTVAENLDLHRRLLNLAPGAVTEVMVLLGLEEYSRRRTDRLSLGNKQRLALARALLGQPDLLVLDEPVNGLDPVGIAEIRTLLKNLAQRGVTVFLSSHLLDEVAQLADRVGLVHRGKLVEQIENPSLRGARRLGVEVVTSDGPRTRALLVARYGPGAVIDREGVLLLTTPAADPAEVARLVVGAGLDLSRLVPVEEDLESRFLRLTAEEEPR